MEIWKDIKGYEGLYQVSNTGRVRSFQYKKERILKLCSDKHNYLIVSLSKNGKKTHKRVHRLVAEAFIPNPDNLPWVLHKDDNPSNSSVDNLKWGNPKDNTNDMMSKNRNRYKIFIGESNPKSVLSEQDVLAIRELRSSTGWGSPKISRYLGLPFGAVNGVLYQNNWSHI